MSKDNDNDDLNMQTFQIYTEEPTKTSTNGKNSNSSNNVVFNSNETSPNKTSELLKGLALGLCISLLFILIDRFF